MKKKKISRQSHRIFRTWSQDEKYFFSVLQKNCKTLLKSSECTVVETMKIKQLSYFISIYKLIKNICKYKRVTVYEKLCFEIISIFFVLHSSWQFFLRIHMSYQIFTFNTRKYTKTNISPQWYVFWNNSPNNYT